MPAEGGPARRMTWLGPDVIVRGWTPEGHILFVTTLRPAVLPQLPRVHARPGRRHAAAAAAGPGESPGVRSGQRRVIGRNTADPARWKRYRGGTAGHLWIDAEGTRNYRRMTELARQHHEPDVDRRARLLPVRCRRRRQPLLVPAGRLRCAAPHRSRRLLCAPCADRRPAHRLSVRRRDLAVRSRRRSHRARRHRACRRIARRRRASSCPPPSHLGGIPRASRRAQRGASTRAASCSRFRCGKARCASTAPTDGVRYRHGQWLADGATLVAVSDGSGEERVERVRGRRPRTLPWDIGRVVAMRAAPRGQPGRDRQPSQRGADRRRRERRADASSTAATPAAPRISPGRPTARGSPTRSGPARGMRDQAARRRGARRSTLVTQPEFRDYCPAFDPRGTISVLPVDAHVRPGVRQRAVRVELSARGAPLPDRAAGRRARRRSTPRPRG